VRIPLVLHGGTGTPEADLRHAISLGIAKVNVASELVTAIRQSLMEQWGAGKNLWVPAAQTVAMQALAKVMAKWFHMDRVCRTGVESTCGALAMSNYSLSLELLDDLHAVPLLDAHTHLVEASLGREGFMTSSFIIWGERLYAAGCPTGARLTNIRLAHSRGGGGAPPGSSPFPSYVYNTSISWGTRIILKDLYGWGDPVTADNWQRVDALIRDAG